MTSEFDEAAYFTGMLDLASLINSALVKETHREKGRVELPFAILNVLHLEGVLFQFVKLKDSTSFVQVKEINYKGEEIRHEPLSNLPSKSKLTKPYRNNTVIPLSDFGLETYEIKSLLRLGIKLEGTFVLPTFSEKVNLYILRVRNNLQSMESVREVLQELHVLELVLNHLMVDTRARPTFQDKRIGTDYENSSKIVNIQLSERQSIIYELLKSGFTNRAIARKLGFSEALVKAETTRIFRLLGVGRRSDLLDHSI